jgi:hypothetical protein
MPHEAARNRPIREETMKPKAFLLFVVPLAVAMPP